jgi:hypothetical protein
MCCCVRLCLAALTCRLQARIKLLRQLCGLQEQPLTEKPDISTSNMGFLKEELEKLATEKVRGTGGTCVLTRGAQSECQAISSKL